MLTADSGRGESNRDVTAQPIEILPAILLCAQKLQMEDEIDKELRLLDHVAMNIFIPNGYLIIRDTHPASG